MEHLIDEDLLRREEAIARWKTGHGPSRAYTTRRRAAEKKQLEGISLLASGVKILAILLLCTYSLNIPAVRSLPHGDVLLVDMTGIEHHSRSYLYDLFASAGLSYVTYNSMRVEDLRLMATGGYSFIIVWGHSGLNDMATSELYSPFHHVFEQLTGQVGRYHVGGNDYFSLEPGLVSGMIGRLHGAVVLLMGCNTMTQTDLARAFVNKGASTVIGWRGLVSLAVTDTTVVTLFQKLLLEHQATREAISETSGLLDSWGLDAGLSTYASD